MATASGRGSGQSPANVTRFLKGIDFPAEKKDLLKHAKQNQAENDVISLIQNMEEREYESMADVMKSYGNEPHRTGKQAQQQQTGKQVRQSESRGQHKPSQHHK